MPEWLGGGPVPEFIRQNPLLVIKPDGLTKGEFYKRHYEVDRSYHGGKTGAEFGSQRWRGEDLGWERRNGPSLWWYGSTPELKAILGGGMGLGYGVGDQMIDEEQSR